jgi:3-methyladenine DNA glycosylase AlkD
MTAKEVLAWLERRGSKKAVAGLARYGVPGDDAFGVPMGALLRLSKELGPDHTLAQALWKSGWHEAKLLAALVDDPQKVTGRQMDAWAKGFRSWADCDTACFKLFDRTPFAWEKARQWAASPREFVKRGGFVLMACLALHDKAAPDRDFLAFLPLLEKGARDDRNFVMKGVSWALRAIGERSAPLRKATLEAARRLAASEEPPCRWVGKDTLRGLATSPARKRTRGRG